MRPATMIAVISTPSSRRTVIEIRSTTKTSAPNWRSCTAPMKPSTTPIRKAISVTMGMAFRPASCMW